jgi:predicted 3-demethylubiquinone-9 3-methyltransferase (glyoxalase superfamily)
MELARKITPCLWFDGQAEEAARFYTSVFPNSKIDQVSRFTDAGQEIHGQAKGTVMAVSFELDGEPFVALNGGPLFKFTEAISFQVFCRDQAEVDRYWDALTEGGDPNAQQCGWLKDKFGVSWQVVPLAMMEWMSDRDAAKAARVTEAMLRMKRFDIEALRRAHAGA